MSKINRLRLFSKEVEPSCSYCKFGFVTHTGEAVLCEKRGVTMPYDSCKKFIYAPLKRVPKRPRELPKYDPSDFSL